MPTTPSARKHHNNNSSPTSTPILKSLLKTNWKGRFKTTRTPYRFAPINPTPLSSASPEKSHFVSTTKNVILLDWWLIKLKTEANSSRSPNAFKFGVGGNAFDGRASMYFCSGEIVKRYDEMTLETGEGIIITLASLLNRFHTLENGFPSQVCDHFFLGFPLDWEEFGAQYFDEQSIHGARSSKGTRISPNDIVDPKCLLSSFDDIPVTRLFDHMMVSSGDYNECQLTRSVFDHILDEYGSSSAKLNEDDTDKIIAEDSLPNETRTPLHVSEENNKPPMARRCSLDKPLKDQAEDKDDNVISQSKMEEDVCKLSKVVLTRSKTSSETLPNYQKEALPLNTSTYPDTTNTCTHPDTTNTSTYPDTTRRTSAKEYGDTITVTNIASVSQSAIPNVENIEVDRVLDSPRYKHCTKPKHLGNDVAMRGDPILEISMSSQELNFLSATLDPGVTAPISAPEVSGNQSIVPLIDMESRTLHKSKNLTDLNTGSGVLTRSKARLTKLRTDPDDITAEPDVTAEECAVHLVQTKKLSDPCPTSEAEKSEKDASNRHVLNKLSKVNSRLDRSEVRRSGRTRNVLQYREP